MTGMTAGGRGAAAGSGSTPKERATEEVRAALTELELADPELTWTESAPGLFSVTLPGTRKLATECALQVGQHNLSVRAFVARRPEENEAGVFGWLLERNLKLGLVAFARDSLGDIYLIGRLPIGVDRGVVDQVLGIVADTADSSFNTILELGFAAAIRREWAWRRSRGESTANLAALTRVLLR